MNALALLGAFVSGWSFAEMCSAVQNKQAGYAALTGAAWILTGAIATLLGYR